MPTGGRKIQTYKWEITGRDGFKYNKEGSGSPTYINVPLNGNGEYTIKLTTTDNENNKVSESFLVMVSDPVAIIKQSPSVGNTSTTFSFDASASYFITSQPASRGTPYLWEIFDDKGDKTDTFQGKNIKKQFIKPGSYVVKLTVSDDRGESNVATQEIYVESTPPIPQFTITPTNKRAKASEFYLDANATTDIDVVNKNDSLEYKWEFSNPNATTLISTEENNKKVVVQFNEVGKHTITLIASDMYGKITTITKEVEVSSILRPELTITPNAITRGRNVSFEIQANKPIIGYQWSFGDGDSRANQERTIQHIYQKI
jgi:PKD repeat protein